MIWLIFVIWSVFAIVCAIVENRTKSYVPMFLFLISIPIMFYVPFMV